MQELFRKIDIFSGLDDKIIRKLADAAILRHYGKGETIVREGELGLGLYIIVRGRVRVHRNFSGTDVDVAELGEEQFFAEMSIIDNKPRSASVSTLEECECLLLTRDSFIGLMKKYPEIPILVARLLAERLRVADERLSASRLGLAVPSTSAKAASTPAADAGSAAASPAGPGEPVPAAQISGNGHAPAPDPAAAGNKARVEQALLRSFQGLYTMKAFTRFSVAILGCPVEAELPATVEQVRVGHVKALLIPAEGAELDIAAYGEGSFNLHVFVPSGEGPIRFGPLPVRPDDRFHLSLDASASVQLSQGARVIAPETA